MPLLWKKAKVSRISRIVADLHPPKPGNSSLVVETGFPTSLVDLFVKNRDRLKKSNKRKKKHQQQQAQVEGFIISDPIPLSNSRNLPGEYVYRENKNERRPENLEGRSESLGDNKSKVFASEDRRNLDSEKIVEGCDGNNERCVLMAVLKMFVVVVLALSTKRLAVGITLSASFLIFLEYVGKRCFCFLQPCLSARMTLHSIQRVLFFFLRRRTDSLEEGKKGGGGDDDGGGGNVVDCSDLTENVGSNSNLNSNSSVEEIQVVEARLDMVSRLGENKRVEHETVRDLLRWDRRWGSLDMEEDEGEDERRFMICGKEYIHNHRIRRKLVKTFVPKKLRAIKKAMKAREREREFKEADLMSEESNEEKLWTNEDAEEQDDFDQLRRLRLWQLMDEKEDGRGNYRTVTKEEQKVKYRKEDEQFEHRGFTSTTELHTKSQKIVVDGSADVENGGHKIVVEGSVDVENGGKSGYLILLLIVLAGLIGGRILALLLTIVCCSMLKLVRRPKKLSK